MKNKKKIVLFLALFSLLIFVGGTIYSYAKYFTSSDNSLGTSIKRWNILVNNETIRNKTTLSNKITANFTNANGHTAENTIAPGVEGELLITIDYSSVDVSFAYDFSINKNETLPDIKLSDVLVYGGSTEGVTVTTDASGITHVTATIPYSETETNKIQTISAKVKWDDDPSTTEMDDEIDTNVGINIDSVDFNVQMNFIQIEE